MWRIKAYAEGVGVMLKDVLVAWSVGPVPTKHLIGLIKKNLGMILFERWGVRPRAKSVLTSSLPHTSRHCHQLQQHDAKNTRERMKENSGQILNTLFSNSAKKKRQETQFEAEAYCQRCIYCQCPLTLLFVLIVWKAHSSFQQQSVLSAKVSHLQQLPEQNQSFGAILYIWIKLMHVERLPGLNM